MNVFHPDPHTVYINTRLNVGMIVCSFENVWIPRLWKLNTIHKLYFRTPTNTSLWRKVLLFLKVPITFPAKIMPRHPLWVFFNCPYLCLRQSRVHAFDYQAQVVQKLDSAIQRIRITKNNCAIDPLDSNLSSGQRYPPFEQLGPGARFSKGPITLRARKF